MADEMTRRERLDQLLLMVREGKPDVPCVLEGMLELMMEAEPREGAKPAPVPRWLCACGWSGAALDQGVCPDCGLGPAQGLAEHAPRLCDGCALKPGDVVRLRSGGPAMTVIVQRPAPEVSAPFSVREIAESFVCEWFNEALGDARSVTLPAAALHKVPDERALELQKRQVRAAHVLLDQAYETIVEIERFLGGSPSALSKEALGEKLGAAREALYSALGEDA